MRNTFFLGLIIFSFILTGCAFLNKGLNKIAPPQYDEQGNEIPGTHSPTPLAKDVADSIPYGSVALNGLLLVVNFIQKVKSDKVAKGLKSTVMAIEQASKDPAIRDAIEQLKEELSNAHKIAGVRPLIKEMLAKI